MLSPDDFAKMQARALREAQDFAKKPLPAQTIPGLPPPQPAGHASWGAAQAAQKLQQDEINRRRCGPPPPAQPAPAPPSQGSAEIVAMMAALHVEVSDLKDQVALLVKASGNGAAKPGK